MTSGETDAIMDENENVAMQDQDIIIKKQVEGMEESMAKQFWVVSNYTTTHINICSI